MKLIEFYKKLAEIDAPVVLTSSAFPLGLNVAKADGMAARLLLWLFEQLPDDATPGDLFAVLDAAKWWPTFWGALPRNQMSISETEEET